MRIVLTGGGTGGHFYPLIAVAEELNRLVDSNAIAGFGLYYLSDVPYDEEALRANQIIFKKIPAGKMRIYASLKNATDLFKTLYGCLVACVALFRLAPDVIFAKGGYASFPTLCAARILGIPVIIHESDAVPGRVTRWAGSFAEHIAVSYPHASQYFPKEKTVYTGQPIRHALLHTVSEGAFEYLHLEKNIPVILIVGGSQGAQVINQSVLGGIHEIINYFQVIHQVGEKNIEEMKLVSDSLLEKHPHKHRYTPIDFLSPLSLSRIGGIASLVISRAGSQLFEITAWQVPVIIIPITESHGDHQRKNAYEFARFGAGLVIEEKNLTPQLLISEINRILQSQELQLEMKQASREIFKPDAAQMIAERLLQIGLSHEA
jgi:UDP-N-acetylglucosamine--N-acetylmuramyl-(pentapeptide) pyrophosphoryl-undecaprenol N-acetylglucosamine transferase